MAQKPQITMARFRFKRPNFKRWKRPRFGSFRRRRSSPRSRSIGRKRVLGMPVTTWLILGALAYFFIAPVKDAVNNLIKKK